MNEIAKARIKVNEQVVRYLHAHPAKTYEQVARSLGVSRWRVVTVAAGLGISRKSGPKPKPQIKTR